MSAVSPPDVGFANVLVPLDGSELALRAMPTARALAERFEAALHTITVAADAVQAGRAATLSAASLGVPVGDDHVSVVTDGEPGSVIAERAATLGSCLVCMGSHGRGRLGGALMGSVARSVLDASREPAVILGPSADNPGWSPAPRGWPEPLSTPRVVACVDGSDESEHALPLATSWARILGMSLTILTVVEDTPDPIRPAPAQARYGGHANAETYIDELVERWRGHGPRTRGDVVRDPLSVASGMRTYLDQHPAGLVVVATHARSGMDRVRHGATAASIVNASTAPCLVAPVPPGTKET